MSKCGPWIAAALAGGFAASATAEAPSVDANAPSTLAATAAASDILASQLASARRANQQVETLLGERTAAWRRRLRVAYMLLRGAGAPLTVAPERRMAAARSRSTARLLLARDRAEITLLTKEVALLTAAIERIARDSAAPLPPLPASLTMPTLGEVVRRFGTLVHERSGAILARRGIDLEVALDAVVVAPAEGVIRYSGPIRGLDHGVIIDHGGFSTVIAKLAPVAFARDLRVARGARIGHPRRHRVYLEVRLNLGPGGIPVDPEPLLMAALLP
jgi:septal ring factor EnvC (AmiA/AmiB activator)